MNKMMYMSKTKADIQRKETVRWRAVHGVSVVHGLELGRQITQ